MTAGYQTRVSAFWWLGRWPYLKFILREASSVFVAWFVVVTLLQIRALSAGREAYAEFDGWLRNPFILILNIVSFFFVVFHAITWFNLTPKAMAVRMGGKRVPAVLVAGPNYVAWIAISIVLAWLFTR